MLYKKNRYDDVKVEEIIERDLVDSDSYSVDNDWDLCSVYVFEELSNDDKFRLIYDVDFELHYDVDDMTYFLEDLQSANLGGIEEERFESIDEVIERLSTYFYDYQICIISKEVFDEIKK